MKKLLLLSTLFVLIVSLAAAKNRKVKVITPYGTMVIRLYDQTPKHRDNFVKLARH